MIFRAAIRIAAGQKAKLLEFRAATNLIRLRRDRGKRNEARELLAPVYGWVTQGFASPLLQDAKALLNELT
jgi:predicted ATPase